MQERTLYYNRTIAYPDKIDKYNDYQSFVHGKQNYYQGFDKIDIEFLRKRLQPAVDFIKAHPDKILWCGEFGTIRHANITWRENFMRDTIKVLKENGIPYCVWNYLSTPNDGNRFSLVDDESRKILSRKMAKIIRGKV